jgi:HPt (histidine-containing phosphotransfer) domain-containing protein
MLGLTMDDNVGEKLNDIGLLITRSGREEEQTVLTILHGLTSVLATVSDEVAKSIERAEQNRVRIEAHQIAIDEHRELVIRGKTSWYWLAGFAGLMGAAMAVIGNYTYTTIAEMRDKINSQQTIKDYIASQSSSISDNKTQITNHAEMIEAIHQEIEKLHALKSIQNSK